MNDVAHGAGWTLHRASWDDLLPTLDGADAVITDPPYSARTHGGQHERRRGIDYAAMAAEDAEAVMECAHAVTRGWIVVMTDHVLWQTFDATARRLKRYAFAPVPLVSIGGRVRLRGDGPACWACWLHVSRPRGEPWHRWGTLPGAYIERGTVKGAPIVGAKQLMTMRRIVRDYTRPGDLVFDPFSGTGTTLLAAVLEGRCAIGCEKDRRTYEYAVKRLRGKIPIK